MSRLHRIALACTVVAAVAASAAVLTAGQSILAPAPAPTQPALTAGDPCLIDNQEYCALNPAVNQTTIDKTICVPGWTATIRPSASFTDHLKRQQLAAFADRHKLDTSWSPGGTEEDHRMPLELGGSPEAPMNLSPESHDSSFAKDQDENSFRRLVCQGKISLLTAQVQFSNKWLRPWPEYAQ